MGNVQSPLIASVGGVTEIDPMFKCVVLGVDHEFTVTLENGDPLPSFMDVDSVTGVITSSATDSNQQGIYSITSTARVAAQNGFLASEYNTTSFLIEILPNFAP